MKEMKYGSDQQSAGAGSTVPPVPAEHEHYEGYFQLVWRRFRKSRVGLIGGAMIATLVVLAVFADFLSPVNAYKINFAHTYLPPQRIHFFDTSGRFHLRPFVYRYESTLNAKKGTITWRENTSRRYNIYFFVHSWKYKILGLIPSNLHLFGVQQGGTLFILGTGAYGRGIFARSCQAGRISLTLAVFAALISLGFGSSFGVISGYFGGRADWIMQRIVELVISFPQLPLWMTLASLMPSTWSSLRIFIMMATLFALLGWTTVAREVRGKVMGYTNTDFILAAKEMGASHSRIIFRHLFPNTLSHVIVVLTVAIPQFILNAAFLSFLGLGIQEPLVSWGLLMQKAQDLQTLGFHLWILTPSFFIIFAVLGFNFLGDGLRDAADPYSNA